VEFYQYITVMLRRFSDSRMHDPCTRICREPLRKLGHDERFVAPALTALKHGISPDAILVGIHAALDYNSPEEPQAVQLRQMLQEQGLDAVLKTVLGLDRRDQLFRMIKAAV
jgi:mannitol-1-phosphate 5-dehydrogenase